MVADCSAVREGCHSIVIHRCVVDCSVVVAETREDAARLNTDQRQQRWNASANDHPCDFTGSTCSRVKRGATLGWDASLLVGGLCFHTQTFWGEVSSLMLHSCVRVGNQCNLLQYVKGATTLLYTGVWCIAVWWWQKPGRMQQC